MKEDRKLVSACIKGDNMNVKPLSSKDIARIKKYCDKGYVDCHACMCPYLEAHCNLNENGNFPYNDEWKGTQLFKDENGLIYIKTDMRINAKFPTKAQVKENNRRMGANFLKSW